MTDTDDAVLEFIRERIVATNMPPTVRKICARFGWSSPSTVHGRLKRLERDGLLEFRPDKGHGSYWPDATTRCPTCGLES
jgi:repressor LexA